MTWFEQLFGFREGAWEATQAQFEVEAEGASLRSRANGRRFAAGRFSTPSVAELRAAAPARSGRARVRHEGIGDVLELHALPENRDAMFQVASQLNCLEFADPRATPEEGVTGYAEDPTQGPACALAAPAATVYRNYFAPVAGEIGQRADRQLDNLADALALLGAPEAFVSVRNGYAFSDAERLAASADALANRGREAFVDRVRIGVQTGAEVSFASRFAEVSAPTTVSQAFCSALSCGYDRSPRSAWAPLATAVLDAAYEATLLAARAGVAAGRCSGSCG
ncbi:hypothetical protein G6O69_38075 [Pseudenhygromyxa sp. WMMC2535]|uniref:hypothetical protein n=1 Tax=Pseudenhygromyxa sp. WMMC2535 TaxID=2712867 RepID=UPI001595C63A|nr:hypothetical protein [Pseudenhygromyxa sp. WMMC2535]NVB43678.1 hypothetical protein [Pseudenhygromyxa sp. WMMC2535]